MGLGDTDVLDDGEGGEKPLSVSCSICLDVVTDNGDRAWAKLMCGHEFHLDCVGSAFNIKGAMQCPNCRKIEKGRWLYANGSRPFPEFNVDDWAHDEDLYDLSYTEMSFGLHWCPFSGLTRLPSSFDERDFSSTAYHHDLLGQHAIFAEQTAVSSASHPCPYIAYLGPIHPSTSNSSGSVSSEGSTFNNHWNNSHNSQSAPSEIPPTSYNFPTMDAHYQRDHHQSSSFPITSSAEHPPTIPSLSQRASRANSDISRPGPGSFGHPFVLGHGSVSRPGNSVTSTMIPPYPGSVARTRDRVQALQAYFQQPTNAPPMRTPVMSSTRRSNIHRGMAQVGSMASSSDHQTGGGFYYFQPGSSTPRNFLEPENQPSNRFHAWEREYMPSFPLNHVDREPLWGPFHQVAGPTSYHQRHGPSHNR